MSRRIELIGGPFDGAFVGRSSEYVYLTADFDGRKGRWKDIRVGRPGDGILYRLMHGKSNELEYIHLDFRYCACDGCGAYMRRSRPHCVICGAALAR